MSTVASIVHRQFNVISAHLCLQHVHRAVESRCPSAKAEPIVVCTQHSNKKRSLTVN